MVNVGVVRQPSSDTSEPTLSFESVNNAPFVSGVVVDIDVNVDVDVDDNVVADAGIKSAALDTNPCSACNVTCGI